MESKVEAKVVVHAKTELAQDEVTEPLKRAKTDHSLLSFVPPVKPKAGKIYIHSHSENPDRKSLVKNPAIFMALSLSVNTLYYKRSNLLIQMNFKPVLPQQFSRYCTMV